ncbi:MAG TPA: PilZ domain-containing protein [Geminicoccaceae bacterium]|nr:PilZ domain-containing protein [Geminicoccaceae bacterium]
MQLQVVHEAEVHRQHVRLKIPIEVEIDGTRFTVDDWSMGGFGIESEIATRQPGERFPVRVVFPFEDFEVSCRLDCQMVYIVEDSSRFGCKFLGLSQGQLGLFRYLVDAYLSGEIVSGGDVLSMAGRDNTAAARLQPLSFDPYAEEQTTGRKIRRWIGYGSLALVSLLLAGLVALGVKDRFLTPEAQSAVVEAPLFRVRAPLNGTLEARDVRDLLRSGSPIGQVRSLDGQVVGLQSPCECFLLEWLSMPGQYVQMGEAVAALIAADRPLVVRAQVDFQTVERLKVGDVAEVTIPGRDGVFLGEIEKIDVRPQLAQLLPGETQMPVARRLAQVIIRPDRPFNFEDLGSLARVRFP